MVRRLRIRTIAFSIAVLEREKSGTGPIFKIGVYV